MNYGFPYTSLHEYLETVLSTMDNPSHQQIKEAKRAYWKHYYKVYRRNQRQVRKEYTLGFGADALKRIQQKKGKLSVSKFLYLVIDRELQSNEVVCNNREVLSSLHQHLMELITLVEELLDSDGSKAIDGILERLDVLEEQVEQFINS